jgi:hypothetical protein
VPIGERWLSGVPPAGPLAAASLNECDSGTLDDLVVEVVVGDEGWDLHPRSTGRTGGAIAPNPREAEWLPEQDLNLRGEAEFAEEGQ